MARERRGLAAAGGSAARAVARVTYKNNTRETYKINRVKTCHS